MSRTATTSPWRRHRVWIFVGLILSIATATVFVLPAKRLRDAARAAVARGRYVEARPLVDRWIASDPSSAEGQILMARIALGLDIPREAQEAIGRARALGYPERDLAPLMAVVAAKQGRHDVAEPVLRRAFAAARGPDALVDEALSKAYIETFDFARAGPVLERWTRDAPESAKPYLWRVQIDRRKGEGHDALIRDFREALARDPGDLPTRLALADELRLAHRAEEAAVEYAAYLERTHEDPAGLLGTALNAIERGNESEAIGLLDRVLKLDPSNARARMERAELALRRNELDRALALFDQAVKVAPDDLKLRYGRSLALARLGREDEARAERSVVERLRAEEGQIDEFRRRLADRPRDVALQCQAARWMIQHGHGIEGIRWAEKALRDRPGDPEACGILEDYHRRGGNNALANYYRDLASDRGSTPSGR